MIVDRSLGSKFFNVVNYLLLSLLALMCLLPLVHVLAQAFSSRAPVTAHLVTVFPIQFTTANFQRLLEQSQFTRSLGVSVLRTLLGTFLNIMIVILTAYPLSRPGGFPGRPLFRWVLIFAMLFNGGLIPLYLAVRSLGLIDKVWALVLPGAVQVFYIIVMVNFFRGLPEEMAEAAIIDGASHWDILFHVFVPLSLPAITTIVLFTAVDHWNAWFDAMIYMTKPDLWPLQTYLQSILMGSNFQNLMANPKTVALISQGGLRAAHIVLTTLPILLIYPFVQRYFISGLTLGAVKG